MPSYSKILYYPCGNSWDYSYHRTVLAVPSRTRPWIDTRLVIGKALIAKLVLAGAMIGIGAYNQSIIHRDSLKAVALTSIASGGSVEPSRRQGSGSTTNAEGGSIDNLVSKFGKRY